MLIPIGQDRWLSAADIVEVRATTDSVIVTTRQGTWVELPSDNPEQLALDIADAANGSLRRPAGTGERR